MGTVKHHGWSKPGVDIPQPTSIIMGKNLSRPVAPDVSRPFGHDLRDIGRWIKDNHPEEDDR
jgi:hypothetical protein